MTSNRLYSISKAGFYLKTRDHHHHLLLVVGLLLWAGLAWQLARCGRLEFDLNEPAASEDDAALNEIKQAADSDLLRMQNEIRVPKTNDAAGSQAERHGQQQQPQPNWLQRTYHWRSKASNAISFVKNNLPDYFDFERFRKTFGRKYSSAEYFYRKAVFLGKCLKVLKSRVAYRLGLGQHLEEVNKFSDRSAPELRRMFMSGPPVEFRPIGQSEEAYRAKLEREFLRREREADEQNELASQSGAGDQDDNEQLDQPVLPFMQLASPAERNLFPFELAGRKPVFNERQMGARLAGIMAMADDDQLRMAIRDELEGGAIAEGYSEAICDHSGQCEHLPASPVGGKPLPWPGRQHSATTEVPDLDRNDAELLSEPIDWSQHKCFHKVYDQGDRCGKCYVMASTTLAEFYKCSEQFNVIDQRKFSKDFVLDCGQKFSPTTIMGCMGGSILDTLKFIAYVGANNIRGWRQRSQTELVKLRQNGAILSGLDLKCPLNKPELKEWGEIKIEMNPRPVQVSDWMRALQDGPLVASVQMPSEGLDSYASGVHEGTGCQSSGLWHSMILVGYGLSERGIAYWRFRNSWGVEWGEAGHFSLAMSVPSECLAGGVRVYREPLAQPEALEL